MTFNQPDNLFINKRRVLNLIKLYGIQIYTVYLSGETSQKGFDVV